MATSKKITKKEAEKAIALETIKDLGLPKGEVIKLLEKLNIDKAIIEEVGKASVPYGHT